MTWLLGLGDLLLDHTQERARKALSSLVQLDASEAFRVEGPEVVRVAAADLRLDDRIVVGPGQRVPADAEVESGVASVDEKALTGESVPRTRKEGDDILAATVVVEGEIVAKVTRTGTETTAARIVQILEEAGSRPMTLQRTIEKSADRLVWPTIATACVSAALSGDVSRLTSVLINDFGTGIRIAVPTNALTAITLASRSGVLIKGAAYLELLAKADVVIFDKTGTLTAGEPSVVDVATLGTLPEHVLVGLAAAAEVRQSHPIAAAVRRRAAASGIDPGRVVPGDVRYAVGRGLAARVSGREVLVGSGRWLREGGVATAGAEGVLARHRAAGISTLLVAVDGALEGALGYADEPRAESAAVVGRLRAGGRRRAVLLSGDLREPALAVGRAVGMDEVHAELLPEDKVAFVEDQKQKGRVVAMVGDGINDAPALTAAHVGISLHGSTDVALEAADVVLLEGGLSKLEVAFEAGEQAMARVRQGVGLVVVPNAAAIVLGAFGIINPAIATVANNGSTLVAALVGVAPLFARAV
jgi:Cu2+-exporting ATPase